MNLALHRSVTFWSGLLVMAFIGWAWLDSLHRLCLIENGSWKIQNARAGIAASVIVGRKPDPIQVHVRKLEPPSPLGTFSPLDYGEQHLRGITTKSVSAPHWLILLAVAPVWLALLFWRARRRKRTATP